jgi:Fe-S cluster assembly protein SufD
MTKGKAAGAGVGIEGYRESFRQFENGGGGPDWLKPVRRAALERSAELGFPTVRDEDWKFTNVTPIARRAFRPPAAGVEPTPGELAEYVLSGYEATRLVFVNGRYAPTLSTLRTLPKGAVAGSLAAALAERGELLRARLSRHETYERDFFSALNTAFVQDGGFVYLPRGVVLEEPIHLLYVATPTAEPAVTHPRNMIIADTMTQGAVVEEYVSLGAGEYFSNAVTELVAADGAVFDHYLIERESDESFSVATLRIEQGRDSDVASHTLLFGGALVRNNVHPILAGEGGHCLVNGLFMPRGRQHMDNFMLVEHASPHCASRQYYNGILNGSARGVFAGRIIVHKGAQKTDAKQTNRNLLLSDDAQMDSKPQLEIFADDVKCTHGATIGQIDEAAVFYLRSRGIARETARALLLFGFAGENLERMRSREVRAYVEGIVADRLPQGEMLKGLV